MGEIIGTVLILLVLVLNAVGAISLIRAPQCRWCHSRLWLKRRTFRTTLGGCRAELSMPVCLQCEFWESRP